MGIAAARYVGNPRGLYDATSREYCYFWEARGGREELLLLLDADATPESVKS